MIPVRRSAREGWIPLTTAATVLAVGVYARHERLQSQGRPRSKERGGLSRPER